MNDSNQPIVKTRYGKIEGLRENGLYVFKGIPYAAPPVGKLRWLPPQPHPPWEGVRPAKQYGAISAQNPMPIPPPGMPPEGQPNDEDCLFLNIWTPGLDDAKRPVMFWIHGGAFIMGSGSEYSIRDQKLAAAGDIVLVSLNYRLGACGFLNLKEITGGRIPATGNEGLLDQIAALEWVRDNIAAFGGDPDNVTAFGFSAGAMSIGVLESMQAARGLFHKAIHHSGAANIIGSLDNAVKMSEEYLKVLGLNSNDIDGLRALSTADLMRGQMELGNRLREAEHTITPFQPVVDGDAVPDWPILSIRKGSAKDIPVLAGTALEEMKLLLAGEPGIRDIDEDSMAARVQSVTPGMDTARLIAAYRSALAKRGREVTPYEILTAIQTDVMFRIPTINLVEAQRDNGQRAWNFIFTWEAAIGGGMLGACHGLDFRYVFGTYDEAFCGTGPDADVLYRKMQDAWLAFARTGDPSCPSIGEWPVYGEKRSTMLFGKDTRLEEAPYEDERRAWEGFDMNFSRPL